MTPLHRLVEHHTTKKHNDRFVTLKDYVNVIKEVCEYYGVPVLDLYSTSGLQPNVEINRELYMTDGLHPTDLGAKRIADMLYSFVKTL